MASSIDYWPLSAAAPPSPQFPFSPFPLHHSTSHAFRCSSSIYSTGRKNLTTPFFHHTMRASERDKEKDLLKKIRVYSFNDSDKNKQEEKNYYILPNILTIHLQNHNFFLIRYISPNSSPQYLSQRYSIYAVLIILFILHMHVSSY